MQQKLEIGATSFHANYLGIGGQHQVVLASAAANTTTGTTASIASTTSGDLCPKNGNKTLTAAQKRELENASGPKRSLRIGGLDQTFYGQSGKIPAGSTTFTAPPLPGKRGRKVSIPKKPPRAPREPPTKKNVESRGNSASEDEDILTNTNKKKVPPSKMTKLQLQEKLQELSSQIRPSLTLPPSDTPKQQGIQLQQHTTTTPVVISKDSNITREDCRTQENSDFRKSVSHAGDFHTFGKQYLREFITFHEQIGNM